MKYFLLFIMCVCAYYALTFLLLYVCVPTHFLEFVYAIGTHIMCVCGAFVVIATKYVEDNKM